MKKKKKKKKTKKKKKKKKDWEGGHEHLLRVPDKITKTPNEIDVPLLPGPYQGMRPRIYCEPQQP